MAESEKPTIIVTDPNDKVTVISPKATPQKPIQSEKKDNTTVTAEKTEDSQLAQQMEKLSIDTNTNDTGTKAVKAEELEVFDYNSIALNMVQFQVEYHFSDANLALDNHLLSKLNQDKEHWVTVEFVANLTKIKSITEDIEIIKKALRKSQILLLNTDETKVKRKDFVPPKPKHHKHMRRSIFVYGLSNTVDKKVIEICSKYGKVNAIVFDDGTQHILNKELIKDSDLCQIDRECAVAIMTRKFGPRAVRSNSASFENALSPTEVAAYLSSGQQRVSAETPANSISSLYIPDSCKAPTSPVFVHPIANPNGDPLDFSHLKTCFVIFKSQSQANKFVRAQAKTDDGIKAMHQYEYFKYQKRESMNRARGISALISPNSIGLAVNSPTYAIIGSAKYAKQLAQTAKVHSTNPYKFPVSPTGAQVPLAYNQFAQVPVQNTFMAPQNTFVQSESSADPAAQFMEFYLANYNAGTPMLIVPGAMADAMAHTFANKLSNTAPHSQKRNSGRFERGRDNYRHSAPPTWSNQQQQNHGNQRFQFDRNQSNQTRSWSHAHRNSQNKKYQYGGSKSCSHRNMKHSWRNVTTNGENKGTQPPAPTPHYFNGNHNERHYVVKKQHSNFKPTHQSPAITPHVASINAPNDGSSL